MLGEGSQSRRRQAGLRAECSRRFFLGIRRLDGFEQRLPLHLGRRRDAGGVENRGRNVHQPGAGFDRSARRAIERQLDQQRHVQSFVVQKHAMRVLAMRAQRLAMIRHHRDQGFVIKPVLAQRVQQVADTGVRVSDLAVVRLRREPFLIGRRWIIRVVRVIQVNPEKDRFVSRMAKPSQGMAHHHVRASLHRLVAVRSVAAKMKARVVHVEPAIKAWRGAVQWVENQRADERRRLVSMLVKEIGQIGQLG